jgi:hypothetical protein
MHFFQRKCDILLCTQVPEQAALLKYKTDLLAVQLVVSSLILVKPCFAPGGLNESS